MKNFIGYYDKHLKPATNLTTPNSGNKTNPVSSRFNLRLAVPVTLAVGLAMSCMSTAQAQEITQINVPTVDGDSATPAVEKKPVDSALNDLQGAYLNLTQVQQEALTSSLGISIDEGKVTVEAIANGSANALLRDLEALGLEKGTVFGNLVSGQLPLSEVSAAGGLANLQFLRLAQRAVRVGAAENQGDEAMEANVARLDFGIDGSGVSIGILSDSYDVLGGELADIASGDIPAGVNVLDDTATGSLIDEGRAMAQLIHDVAPGADLLFHTAFNGAPDFAQGILDLAAAGADVIVDDVGYFLVPMFQDGVIAQAVDTVEAAGVVYFSSAGNGADKSYEAPYVDSGLGLTNALFTFTNSHAFDGVSDNIQEMELEPGQSLRLSIQWDQPFASAGGTGSASDIDAYLIDTSALVIASATNGNIGGDAVEFLTYTNNTGATQIVGLVIGVFSGPVPGHIKWVNFGSDVPHNNATNSSTTYGHPNAEGAIAVGAADYQQTPVFGQSPPLLEPFSSLGGTQIRFDTAGNPITPVDRNKPEIVAPDGVDNTFFGFDSDGTGFPNFFGTSAAAPNAAAVAALQLECNPMLTPADIQSHQASTAIDMESPGFDNLSGDGLINASAIMNLSCAPVPLCNGLAITVDFNLGQTTTPGPDVVLGTPGPDDIRGKAGDDTICGMGGDDFIHGNSGDDWIDGGDGVDNIRGGQGNDMIFTGLGATVGTGSRAFGGYGDDEIIGNVDADDLRGGRGNDFIFGDEGDDEIFGNDDADQMDGGPGDDVMKGGLGDDSMIGSAGADDLNGGSGTADECVDDGVDILSNCEILL